MHTESYILKHMKHTFFYGNINISTTATCWHITDLACSLHVCELHVSKQDSR